jgi:guanylate kinase
LNSMAAARGKLIIVSGPSGAGKSTICKELVKRLGAWLSVSATTRPKSSQETDGADYYFISKDEFLSRIEKKDFLEWAKVFDNLYGTPKSKIEERLAAGTSVILEIDVQGGLQVIQMYPEAVTILVMPPDEKTLAGRISGRGRDSEDVMAQRLAKAQEEVNAAKGFYKYTVINDQLDPAINEIINIVERSGEIK